MNLIDSFLMGNKYVDFISDEHLLKCIASFHKDYLKAKNNTQKLKLINCL